MQPLKIIFKNIFRYFQAHYKQHKSSTLNKTTFIQLTNKAQAGCIKSQRTLGDYYLSNIEPDIALFWYDQAALQGDRHSAIQAFSIEPNDSRKKIAGDLMLEDPQLSTNVQL